MVQWALGVVAAYLLIGVLVALYLHAGRLGRIDPAAKAAPVRVRLLITPGLILLWPVFFAKTLGAHSN